MRGVFHPEDWLRFVQLTPFSQKWDKFGLDDEDLRSLEVLIMAKPDVGRVIPGAGRLRKARFAGRTLQKGKRGAFRICYVYFEEYRSVVLVTIFAKNENSDLSEEGKKMISAVIRECKQLFDKGDL